MLAASNELTGKHQIHTMGLSEECNKLSSELLEDFELCGNFSTCRISTISFTIVGFLFKIFFTISL